MSDEKARRSEFIEQFPRAADLPRQSPQYWAREKDRYLRQLLIRDIQSHTGRPLVVYFASLSAGIARKDADDLSEVLEGVEGDSLDLMLQTPGGDVDACEKIIAVLKSRFSDYRVLVPSIAKSAGTVVALSSKEIVLGINSELGPIDPQFVLPDLGQIPCEIIMNDESQPPSIRVLAKQALERMRRMAERCLSEGMLQSAGVEKVEEVLSKISTSTGYLSHGAVIDSSEAKALGLNVLTLDHTDELWKRMWLLYCMYEYDIGEKKISKIFEEDIFSIARRKTH